MVPTQRGGGFQNMDAVGNGIRPSTVTLTPPKSSHRAISQGLHLLYPPFPKSPLTTLYHLKLFSKIKFQIHSPLTQPNYNSIRYYIVQDTISYGYYYGICSS